MAGSFQYGLNVQALVELEFVLVTEEEGVSVGITSSTVNGKPASMELMEEMRLVSSQ